MNLQIGQRLRNFCASRFQEVGGRLVLLNLGRSKAQRAEILQRRTLFPDRVVPRYDILEFLKEQQLVGKRDSVDPRDVLRE